MRVRTAVAICLVAVAVAAGEEGAEEGRKEVKNAPDKIEVDRRAVKLFAFSTTTSIKRLATTTITAINTCLSTLNNAPACTGRRKRTAFSDLLDLEGMSELDVLHGSQREAREVETEGEEAVAGQKVEEEVVDGKLQTRRVEGKAGKKLTIWSSIISTLTLTSTSFLAGTTVTATALCIAPGVVAGCFGK